VFDVEVHARESTVDAWMRGVEMVPGKTLLVIDPQELARFAESYYGIPAPPPDVAAQPRPFVVRR
jgi:hypothetical protein